MHKQILLGLILAVFIAINAAPTGTQAQTAQNAPPLAETINYITAFLASHGCTEYDTTNFHKQSCSSLSNADNCSVEVESKLVLTPTRELTTTPIPKLRQWTVNLQLLDPTSAKTQPDIHSDDGSFPDQGLDVTVQAQAGGIGLALPVDNTDNATHLINALSHAITLCGGKKAAF
ncbi:hypothetical protein [Acidicapsa acidisoli]|uniref:hypothetical protein n=1 Tax=Acidicapsa acidisoli TaxID=1615681 RepID=UPI0021E06CF1|nr:hypothetical protein [Acidicapsa acidisoli]